MESLLYSILTHQLLKRWNLCLFSLTYSNLTHQPLKRWNHVQPTQDDFHSAKIEHNEPSRLRLTNIRPLVDREAFLHPTGLAPAFRQPL